MLQKALFSHFQKKPYFQKNEGNSENKSHRGFLRLLPLIIQVFFPTIKCHPSPFGTLKNNLFFTT